jgi:hypothetical protein
MFPPRPRVPPTVGSAQERQATGYDQRLMAAPSDIPLEQQLEEIRTQLAWVRDYL